MILQAIREELQSVYGLMAEVNLAMDTIAQGTHECKIHAAIKQVKQLKPLLYGEWWLKYKHGDALQHPYSKIKQCNGLLKTAWRAVGGGNFKCWDTYWVKTAELVSSWGLMSEMGLPNQNFYVL